MLGAYWATFDPNRKRVKGKENLDLFSTDLGLSIR